MECSILKETRTRDEFAEIAGRLPEPASQGGLAVALPPTLPDRLLPSRKSDPQAALDPAAPRDNFRALRAALDREQRRMARFLESHAPPLRSTRIVKPLKRFHWRIEREEDRPHGRPPRKRPTPWREITIPHYGPPIGRATTVYRTSFSVSARMMKRGRLFICFGGVDYIARASVNGQTLGTHEGFFAPFEFDATGVARLGENRLEIRVENDGIAKGFRDFGYDTVGNKLYAATGPGWDEAGLGWHHCPPGMGIYQKAWVEARPACYLADLFVRPLGVEGDLEVRAEVVNASDAEVSVSIAGALHGENFRKTVFRDRALVTKETLAPGSRTLPFGMRIRRPRLWSPDTPWLYRLTLALREQRTGRIDRCTAVFGVRTFTQDATSAPRGRFFLNGREIKLRGANTMGYLQQDVMHRRWKQLEEDLLLGRITNMNFLRLTQRPVQPEIYEACDRLGILVQTDFPLFGMLPRAQADEALRQVEEMERLVRGHPCCVLSSFMNEPFPASWGTDTKRNLSKVEMLSWYRRAEEVTQRVHPGRIIKPVDGDYDPPTPGLPDRHIYAGWYNGHGIELGKLHRGHFPAVPPDWQVGCGEFGSEGLDPVDVMERYYPDAWVRPARDGSWSPERIVKAQTHDHYRLWFERQVTMKDWVRASQEHQAWATRLVTEALRRNNLVSSMAIHLFIDAFPAGWMKTIMDVRRRPKLAWYAYRDALEPLTPNIYANRTCFFSGEAIPLELWVLNDTHRYGRDLALHYQLEGPDGVVFSRKVPARIEAMRAVFQGHVQPVAPDVPCRTTFVFRCALIQRGKQRLAETDLQVDVFPAHVPVKTEIQVVGRGRGPARRLVAELDGVAKVSRADGVLIDSPTAYAAQRRTLNDRLRRGARVVLLNWPPGDYRVAGRCFTVEACGMQPRQFVARNPDHPLVSGFHPTDFRFWHDPRAGYPTPLLSTTFDLEGWKPLLLTGQGDWGRSWYDSGAVAACRVGKGTLVLCQLELAGRTINPPARIFAERMLSGPLL